MSESSVQTPGAMRPLSVEMVSDTDPRVTYVVHLPSCTCPHFRWGTKGEPVLCKHLQRAYARAAAWQV